MPLGQSRQASLCVSSLAYPARRAYQEPAVEFAQRGGVDRVVLEAAPDAQAAKRRRGLGVVEHVFGQLESVQTQSAIKIMTCLLLSSKTSTGEEAGSIKERPVRTPGCFNTLVTPN